MRNFIVRFAALTCLIVFVGCGEPTANLTGNVTIDDKPLDVGNVKIFDGNGAVHSCRIQSDGTYTFEGVAIGNIKFLVSSVRDTEQIARLKGMGGKDSKAAAMNAGVSSRSTKSIPNFYRIPKRYMSVTDSGLAAEIVAGDNTHDLSLTSDGT